MKNYELTPYSRNRREINTIFYLKPTDQIQNILRELCYHAPFFHRHRFNKRVSKDERYDSPTSQVAALISRGKEQGYLTYAEVTIIYQTQLRK